MIKRLEPHLSTKEAAELLGVCKQMINAKIARRELAGARRCECGKTDMVPLSEIHRYMREHNRRRRPRNP
jgi:excisionase family DNA binding protein